MGIVLVGGTLCTKSYEYYIDDSCILFNLRRGIMMLRLLTKDKMIVDVTVSFA